MSANAAEPSFNWSNHFQNDYGVLWQNASGTAQAITINVVTGTAHIDISKSIAIWHETDPDLKDNFLTNLTLIRDDKTKDNSI